MSKLYESFNMFVGKTEHIFEKNKANLSRRTQSLMFDEHTKVEEREDMLSLLNTSHQEILCVEKTGIERCDIPEPFHGSKKQMMKVVNYWIFYYSVICEGTFLEPSLHEIPVVRGKKVIPPIRCAFCKLVKNKEYLNNYFRYDPAKRCG
jgi:hypothetical protein